MSVNYHDTPSVCLWIQNNQFVKFLDVMLEIEKKSVVQENHQIRIIGLVEADFNTTFQLFFTKHLVVQLEYTNLTKD